MNKAARLSSTQSTTFEIPATTFMRRHIGPAPDDVEAMLKVVGAASLDDLIGQTIPPTIRRAPVADPQPALSEIEALARLRELADRNRVFTSLIGCGYSGTILPAVI
ncbi:MAG TPA: glycine dehydrogenase (aminomethyl-transferring), partial [Blastocatellia bacterium]|nr:glycine dehydrogenase (aminomethyl-transferring) [Blastocatellia bacterium]